MKNPLHKLGLLCAALLLSVGWIWHPKSVATSTPQYTYIATFAGDSSTVTVSGTVLRVLGSSSWTGATTNGATDRIVSLTNCSRSGVVYVKTLGTASSTTGAVTNGDFYIQLAPGEQTFRLVHGNVNGVAGTGTDVAIVSDGSNVTVHAEEEVYR